MKTSLAWLNSYLDRPADANEAQQQLARVGFPVDSLDEVALPSGTRDAVLEVEVTSNRSDCLCHLGLARELAAATDRVLTPPPVDLPAEAGPPVDRLARVIHEGKEWCPLYTARVIEGVTIGPSPSWLVDRLQAAGLRSVNNVVDITNFVLLEMGQPLHAFDLARLEGRCVVVRRARQGEPFVAIDSSRHELTPQVLVIADEQRPVAVAGVMGGLESEVTSRTRDILLESAMFEPLAVRRASRMLKLASDSSYRFERGVDPRGVEAASRRAAALILELAGGRLAQGVIRVGQPEPTPHQVSMRVDRCNALLGLTLTPQQQAQYLARLGLEPRLADDHITCTIPTHRLDLRREVDLIEEVARLHGLEQIPTRDRIAIEVRPQQQAVLAQRELGRVLVAHGYHETITFSFVSPKHGRPFVPAGREPVLIPDDRRRAEPMLRPSLLPSLLLCRKSNQDLGNTDVRLFEAAATWHRHKDEIIETQRLALLRDADDPQQALRELRGAMEELIERLGGAEAKRSLRFESESHANFAAAVTIRLGDAAIGHMGLVDDATCRLFDVKTALVAAEVELDRIIALYPPQRQVEPLPRFPAIERDLSVVVDQATPWENIQTAVEQAQLDKLEGLTFIGTYRGKPIEPGRKSVSFRLIFRDPAKTLRHEEVDPQVARVVEVLKDRVGAQLRG
ncbi:MAG TPA: phenylalanine--tRNA ligase subunit beta [Phycisphaeraceae bacterium]